MNTSTHISNVAIFGKMKMVVLSYLFLILGSVTRDGFIAWSSWGAGMILFTINIVVNWPKFKEALKKIKKKKK